MSLVPDPVDDEVEEEASVEEAPSADVDVSTESTDTVVDEAEGLGEETESVLASVEDVVADNDEEASTVTEAEVS